MDMFLNILFVPSIAVSILLVKFLKSKSFEVKLLAF